MAITITGIPDCKAVLGPSQFARGTQLQPGAADYPSGGYFLPCSLATSTTAIGKLEGEFVYGGWLMSGNAAAAAYNVDFVANSGYGTTPGPGTGLTMIVSLLQAGAGQPIGLSPVSTGVSTTIGVTSNVITVAQPNTLIPGQFVVFRSTGAGAAISGTILQVATANATTWTANYPTPNITAATADVTITYQIVQAGAGNQVTTGASATITNSLATSSLLTMTCANTFVPGNFVIIQGLTNGANANGVVVQVLTASSTQFTAIWTGTAFSTAADAGTAQLLVTSGGAPIATANFSTITNSLATASSAGVAGVITLTAIQNYAPNTLVLVNGMTNGAAANGDVLVVNQASLTGTSFVSNHKTAAFTSASDSGSVSQLVTGIPTGAPQVAPGTDLSACTWFAEFLTGGE